MSQENLLRGVLPGVIAGHIFLAYAPGWQGLVGSNLIRASAFVGFFLHIIISIVIAAIYTGLFRPNVDLGNPLLNILVGGLLYGLIWWVIGDNIIVAVIGEYKALQFNFDNIFYGHIIYGHVLAFIVTMRDQVLANASSSQ